jgi:hypothetical protein
MLEDELLEYERRIVKSHTTNEGSDRRSMLR